MAQAKLYQRPQVFPDAPAPLVLRLAPVVKMTELQFFKLCQLNDILRLERTSEGDLVIMGPAGGETSRGNAELTRQVANWTAADGTGVVFDATAGFRLPNGATRSPDAAWLLRSRWEALPLQQRRRFAPICPDFVVELRSPSDSLHFLQGKMQEYIDNGARLGWLIDALQRQVYLYRPGVPVERLDDPRTLSGDPVLPGLVLDLSRIWSD